MPTRPRPPAPAPAHAAFLGEVKVGGVMVVPPGYKQAGLFWARRKRWSRATGEEVGLGARSTRMHKTLAAAKRWAVGHLPAACRPLVEWVEIRD